MCVADHRSQHLEEYGEDIAGRLERTNHFQEKKINMWLGMMRIRVRTCDERLIMGRHERVIFATDSGQDSPAMRLERHGKSRPDRSQLVTCVNQDENGLNVPELSRK